MRVGVAVMVIGVIGVIGLCGCDVVFGIDGQSPPIDAEASPVCGATPELDPSGCACNTPGAVQTCFHGQNGPDSACRQGGSVTCGDDHVWSACTGGVEPAQETCFDGVDNNCDGVIDEGCTCAQADNVCFDEAGVMYDLDTVRASPATVAVNGLFSVWALSRGPLPSAALQTETTFCTGTTSTACTAHGACAGWTIIAWTSLRATTTGTPHMFTGPGEKALSVRIDDVGPCTTDSHVIKGTLVLQ